MSGKRTYDPGVAASVAQLPGPPEHWSHSTLKEVESCARRYVLGRASYPDLWTGWGYPEQPNAAALFGDVIHDSLERITKALNKAGCTSLSSTEAVVVLRDMGGYSEVAKHALDARLAKLDGNPRFDDGRRARLKQLLENRIPEARTEIQGHLQRISLQARANSGPAANRRAEHRPLGFGSHAEAALRVDHLRVKGRVDLLTVTAERADIVDYKTGMPDSSHLDQLRFYAMLWNQDEVANPNHTPLGTLTASYPNAVTTYPAPDEEELASLAMDAAARVATADARVELDVPVATPGDQCMRCSVRSLCDTYWDDVAPNPAELRDGVWFDYEGTVGEQNGVKSWWMVDEQGRNELLLRTPPGRQLSLGQRLRIIGLRRDDETGIDTPVAAMTTVSELFAVVGKGG